MENEDLEALGVRPGSPFLTSKQAAGYVSLSPRTLEKMRETADGPRFRKHGRYVRYHIEDLKVWSEERGYRSISDEGTK